MSFSANRKTDVAIIGGLGHVGLPLGISLASKGLQVCLYDIDSNKADLVRQGQMPFIEYGADEILQKVIGNELTLSTDISCVGDAKYIVIAIGTPIDEYLNPRMKGFFQLFDNLSEYLDESQTIVIRSTVYPKICEQLDNYLQKRGLKIAIAYCPERIVQGYSIRELDELPQIVAGNSEEAQRRGGELFARLSPKIIPASMGEAELIKLFANAWRYIQFAVTNQFYMISTLYGEDYDHLRNALVDGYGRAADLPAAGFAAGPCLLKDTMQLASFTANNFQLGHAAMMVNEGLPDFIVSQMRQQHDLAHSTVGVLGMAFKANIDDIRDSLSYRVKKVLQFHGATVLCSDYLVPDESFVSSEELIDRSDIIIIGAPHSQYRHLDIPEHKTLVDVWGCVVCPEQADNRSPDH